MQKESIHEKQETDMLSSVKMKNVVLPEPQKKSINNILRFAAAYRSELIIDNSYVDIILN